MYVSEFKTPSVDLASSYLCHTCRTSLDRQYFKPRLTMKEETPPESTSQSGNPSGTVDENMPDPEEDDLDDLDGMIVAHLNPNYAF